MNMVNTDLPLFPLVYKANNRLEKPYLEDNISPNKQKRSYCHRLLTPLLLICWASRVVSPCLTSCIYFCGWSIPGLLASFLLQSLELR